MQNTHDMSLVERDPALKGLRYMLDADRLRQLLEGDGLLAPAMLEGLSVDYLRYKPGVNCIARLRCASGFGYAKAFAVDAATKLAKARQRPAVAGPSGVGRICFDDPGILLNFFPNDVALPKLAQFADPATRRAALKRIFKSDTDWLEASYRPLNYKPERRFVAQLVRADGQAASLKFYLQKEFSSIRLTRKKFALPQGVQIPQWIGGSKSHRVMAYSWLPGVTLRSHLELGRSGDCRLAGEAIAHLHQSEQSDIAGRDDACLKAILESLGGQLGHLVPELEHEARKLARKLGKWLQERVPRACTIHGDFYDNQVVIQDGVVGIIDSDRMELGDPEFDLGCFMSHLELRRIDGRLSADLVKEAGSALMDGYLTTVPANFIQRNLNAYTAFNLFRLSHHPFRDRRPDWAEQTAALLTRCEQLLTDGD